MALKIALLMRISTPSSSVSSVSWIARQAPETRHKTSRQSNLSPCRPHSASIFRRPSSSHVEEGKTRSPLCKSPAVAAPIPAAAPATTTTFPFRFISLPVTEFVRLT